MILGCPEILITADDLALASVSLEGLKSKLQAQKGSTLSRSESQCKKTKMMFRSEKARKLKNEESFRMQFVEKLWLITPS